MPPIEKCKSYFPPWALLSIPLFFSSYHFGKYVERNSKNLTTFGGHENRSNPIVISQNEMKIKENLRVYLREGQIFILISLTVSCVPWLFVPSLLVAILYDVSLYIFGFYLIYLNHTKNDFDHFV
ncbi:unnamed protein product [Caenorhabditis nigoni]